jgi:DNA invertase Pin-like site-specific DNA recombinase
VAPHIEARRPVETPTGKEKQVTVAAVPTKTRQGLTPEKRELARRLHARNVTYTKIGQMLGVDSSTVWRVLNPKRVREQEAKRQLRLEEEAQRPRKIGQQLPWEGVNDEEYRC